MNHFAVTHDTLLLLSQSVRATRASLGISSKDLALNLGLGKNTVARFENRGYGDYEVLLKLLTWLNDQEEIDAETVRRSRGQMVAGYGEQATKQAVRTDLGRIAR